ncbi:MAG: hypothetical protein AABX11_02815 [Nanoarchaeota archaeon]
MKITKVEAKLWVFLISLILIFGLTYLVGIRGLDKNLSFGLFIALSIVAVEKCFEFIESLLLINQ